MPSKKLQPVQKEQNVIEPAKDDTKYKPIVFIECGKFYVEI